MTALLSLAARSAWSRRYVLALVALTIALASFMLLAIERLRVDVRSSFSAAVSGTDLIVGARGGSTQLLLYSVFRIGSATNTMSWAAAEALANHRLVAWAVPISLGDSHRGFPVVATTAGYFEHFRYGEARPLALAEGRRFEQLYDVVLGAEVAERLGYGLGQRVVLSHGDGAFAANDHQDKPFTVVGILARTGTPVDRSLHIGLEAMQAIHLDWIAGAPLPGLAVSAEEAARRDLRPKRVTAVLVGLKSRAAVFRLQREIADATAEPLTAVLPGVALDELWQAVGQGERALLAMSALVSAVSLVGLVAVILAGLDGRRRELAILRAVGVGPRRMLGLLALEGTLTTALGVAAGAVACALAIALGRDAVLAHYGVPLSLAPPTPEQWWLLGAILAAGALASLAPAWFAYRLSLHDGLTPRT